MLTYYDIEGWCAGCKVSGITDTSLSHKNFPSLETILHSAVEQCDASVICVSVNENEEKVLKWLKDNKFRRGPVVKNFIHNGHKTWMYFKQIPKKVYNEVHKAALLDFDRWY